MTDYLDQFGHNKGEVDCECWAIHILPGPEYGIWQVDYFWLSPHSDLAVFHTKPYNDVAASVGRAPCLGLELAPPQRGERVVGFGYQRSTGLVRVDIDGTRHIEVNAFGAATVGEVQEVFVERRDSGKLNFPCYQVNARFDGGMSGGPLLSDRGRVCGVVCSTYPADSDFPHHTSYAATLWPLMGLAINIDLSGKIVDDFYPLLDLARRGVIAAADWEKVSLTAAPEPANFTVHF